MTDEQKKKIMKLRAKGTGYGTIAQMLGISMNTVKSYCRRHAADVQKAEETGIASCGVTQCENCGRRIEQAEKRKRKRFCCDACRNQWWNSHLDLVKRKAVYDFVCPNCGKKFQVYGDKRRKYCSHDCYIADRFKGGVRHA